MILVKPKPDLVWPPPGYGTTLNVNLTVREHGANLQKPFMVGAKLADIEVGERAGCHSVFVLTGSG